MTPDGGPAPPESVTEPKFREPEQKLFITTLAVKCQFKFYELDVTLRHQLTAVNVVTFASAISLLCTVCILVQARTVKCFICKEDFCTAAR